MTNPVPTHAPKTDTTATQAFLERLSRDELGWFVVRLRDEVIDLESTLAAERASRTYAEMEAQRIGFEQGIEAAATHCEESEVMLPIEKFMETKQALGAAVALTLAVEIRGLSKPSGKPRTGEAVSPEF